MLKLPILFLFCYEALGEIHPVPRGVPLIKKPLYDRTSKSHFQCLDNSMTIPFDWVNDEYCDCKDGSDEPGTSACSNGRFYCLNLGHKPLELPSSRVNDHICDCCDGSDEWANYVKCENYCEVAGKAARDELERLNAIQQEGFEKRKAFLKAARDKKQENEKSLTAKREEREQLSKQLEELDMVKQVAEKSEREAKDLHTERWKAELEASNKVKHAEKAAAAFEELDINKDKKITVDELKYRMEFDKNLDGNVAEDEITEYLGGKQETELEHFVNEVWYNIKHIYRPTITTTDAEPSDSDKPRGEKSDRMILRRSREDRQTFEERESEPVDDEEPVEDEVKDDEVEDFEPKDSRHDQDTAVPSSNTTNFDEKMPDYDEDTKKLIADADQARKEYNDVDAKIKDIDRDIKQGEDYTKMDFGPEDEFASLYKQCFELSDPQYTYGLCVFDRTFQKPKDGGHGDVILGNWGSWQEYSIDNKYASQTYNNGITCWNGPARSTQVKFTCGLENKLIAASEPARCEYAMEFETPAACSKPVVLSSVDDHTEL